MNDTEPSPPTSEESVRDRLQLEAGELDWPELARHFARGVVITVARGNSLLEVAERIAGDDSAQLQRWLDDNELARASDDDARRWNARTPCFDCVVVAPWVLVQERTDASG